MEIHIWKEKLSQFWWRRGAAAAAKSRQSCPTLCDPIDGSPPGSSVPGILQARTLEWVAISFSNAWKWKMKVKSLSRVRLLAIPWTAAYQAPPFMGVSSQEYWSGSPVPSPEEGRDSTKWTIRTLHDRCYHGGAKCARKPGSEALVSPSHTGRFPCHEFMNPLLPIPYTIEELLLFIPLGWEMIWAHKPTRETDLVFFPLSWKASVFSKCV